MERKHFVELSYAAQIVAIMLLPLAALYTFFHIAAFLVREAASWWFGTWGPPSALYDDDEEEQ